MVNSTADEAGWNFESSVVSTVGALTANSGLVVSLPQNSATVSQILPVGCVSASASQSFNIDLACTLEPKGANLSCR